ncbi:MAG TPA: hypothetical protein PLW81_07840 [Thiobacillaceae bacterium]|nr:hypothetical protein [Thiobacillaceae bacterium]
MEITVYRDQSLLRQERTLPAAVYNLARTLQRRSPSGVAFVPIRSMQVLAILDRDEFVFLDSQHKTWAMLAWQRFRPDERASLDDPVGYELACYEEDALEAMKRLPREFHLALQALASKDRIDGPARVLKFEARRPG